MASVVTDSKGMDFLETRRSRFVTLWLPLSVFLFVLLFPFYWMVITTLKPNEELLSREGNPFWVVVADADGKAAIDWGVYGAPETFLVDGNGIVRWKHVGPLSDAIVANELMPALQRAEGSR